MTSPAKPRRKSGPSATSHRISDGWGEGWTVHVSRSGVHVTGRGVGRSAAPLRLLAKHHDVDSPLWQWLRSRGVVRPQPSGASGPSGQRVAPRTGRVDYRPSPEALQALDALAARQGCSRNAALDGLVLTAVGRG